MGKGGEMSETASREVKVAVMSNSLGFPFMDCGPPGSSPGKNTGVGCRALLQGRDCLEGVLAGEGGGFRAGAVR